jgi:hypothetical protein
LEAGVETRWQLRFSVSCQVFSVHEVRAHETNEFEEAMRFFRELLQSAQKKTAIWMRKAFSDRPTNRVILGVCFITGKNSSTASSACTDPRSPERARRDRW